MKKRIVASAVVLAAVLVTPKYISTQVNQVVDNGVAGLNETPTYKADIKSQNFGWFSSSAVVEVSLDMSQMAQQDPEAAAAVADMFTFNVNIEAEHGPVIFGQEAGIGLVAWSISYAGEGAEKYISWDKNLPLYEIKGKTGLTGSGHYSDNIPAFTAAENDEGNVVDFSGYAGGGEFNAEGYTYKSHSEKLMIDSTEFAMGFSDISIDADAKGSVIAAFQGELFDSTASILMKKLNIQEKTTGQNFDITDTLLATQTTMSDDSKLADVTVDYKIAEIAGAEFVASDLSLSMAVNKLSIDFFKAYQKLSQELNQTQPEVLQAQMMTFAQENLLTFLTPSPELNVTDFHGTLPQGKFVMTADSKIVNVDALPANLMDPGFWLSHLVANAHLEADDGVITMIAAQQMQNQLMANPDIATMSPEEIQQIIEQQTPMMLQNLTQQGLLIKTEDGYKTSFTLADSQAKINETPIPLPGL